MKSVHDPLLPYRRNESKKRKTKRLVHRSGSSGQSNGSYNIRRIGGNWKNLYFNAPYHTILNTRTSRIIVGVFTMYFAVIFAFAICFRVVHDKCDLGVTTMMQAWMFSLETIMTIGYGAPQDDIFYEDCMSMAVLLTLESFAGIFLDSICIGIFFARFSRAQSRASTIIFTQTAIIRKIEGHFYLMFQVCERRKHQLVEAHIRLYAVRHQFGKDGSEEALFQSHHMRVQQPDDDLGSFLLMALPQMIVHRIDPWSPLFPPECLPTKPEASSAPSFPNPLQRSIDTENGSRDISAKASSVPNPTQAQIETHLLKSDLEVIVILEGIDGPTSATMQARHSYTSEDMQWHHQFQSCVQRDTNGGALIDFDRLHNTYPTNESIPVCPPSIH